MGKYAFLAPKLASQHFPQPSTPSNAFRGLPSWSGGGGPSRISDLQVRSGPKMGHCGQRGSEENTANTSKNGPELYIVIARNVLGTAQNTVNYGKICVFAFLGRCVSSLASGDGGHKTLQIALKIGCLAFSGAIFSAR